MNRLLEIGFIPVGHWNLNGENISCNITSHHREKKVLYSFISNGEIKYIGKTIMSLAKRMYAYQNPNVSQSTNIRVNGIIKNMLVQNLPVDIFILVDNGLLSYGNFKINLAAALEDTLIFELNPEWNFSGKNKISEDLESEKSSLPESLLINEITPALTSFEILLGEAYYNQGFFNIKQQFSDLIAGDKINIEIRLGQNSKKIIHGYINRTANNNGTPRIMGGSELRQWINENYKQNDLMKIDVISPVSLCLYTNPLSD